MFGFLNDIHYFLFLGIQSIISISTSYSIFHMFQPLPLQIYQIFSISRAFSKILCIIIIFSENQRYYQPIIQLYQEVYLALKYQDQVHNLRIHIITQATSIFTNLHNKISIRILEVISHKVGLWPKYKTQLLLAIFRIFYLYLERSSLVYNIHKQCSQLVGTTFPFSYEFCFECLKLDQETLTFIYSIMLNFYKILLLLLYMFNNFKVCLEQLAVKYQFWLE